MGALILASGSPQRKAILEQLGVAFEVVVSNVPELESGPPEEVVLENAYRKAQAVAGLRASHSTAAAGGQKTSEAPARSYSDEGPAVLGVDTIVALGGRLYGKPKDEAAARAVLQTLSGRTHRVLSGVCVIEGGETRTAAAVTSVTFREIEPALLEWYLDSGEWRGRAGGYAIQGRGAALVAGIEGDYLNVVGLPVQTLVQIAPHLLFPGVF